MKGDYLAKIAAEVDAQHKEVASRKRILERKRDARRKIREAFAALSPDERRIRKTAKRREQRHARAVRAGRTPGVNGAAARPIIWDGVEYPSALALGAHLKCHRNCIYEAIEVGYKSGKSIHWADQPPPKLKPRPGPYKAVVYRGTPYPSRMAFQRANGLTMWQAYAAYCSGTLNGHPVERVGAA